MNNNKIISEGITFEKARGNIDIGGLTMLRAGAKNFLGCAAVCDPNDYSDIIEKIKADEGCTTFEQRLNLATKVFRMTANYDKNISNFLDSKTTSPYDIGELKKEYDFGEE